MANISAPAGYYAPGSPSWDKLMNQGPLPAQNEQDDELQAARRAALNFLQYQPRTPDWQTQVNALRGGLAPTAPPPVAPVASPFAAPTTAPPSTYTPAATAVSPFAPAATPSQTVAPGTTLTTQPPAQQNWQEILDSFLKKLGGAGAQSSATAPFTKPTPGMPSAGKIQMINDQTREIIEVVPGSSEHMAALQGPYRLYGYDSGTVANLTDQTKVPTTPLPNGYQWKLQSGTKETPVLDPVTGKPQVDVNNKVIMQTEQVYQWTPDWIGTGAMDDYQKAKISLDEAQGNAALAQKLLTEAVAQGNADRTFAAQQQLNAANLELSRAKGALDQAQFAESQKQSAQGQANWEKNFTSAEQKTAFDQLVQMSNIAANPRNFIQLWLTQQDPWYKDIVGQVMNKGTQNLAFAPPSLGTYNKLTPSAREGFASVLSSQGIPPEDYMNTVAQTLWPKKAAPTSTAYSPFMQR